MHGILACLPQNRKTVQPSSGGQFRPIDDDDGVSTGSGYDRVSTQATVEVAKVDPVATASGTDLITNKLSNPS